MTQFVNNYIISLILLIAFIIASPLMTNWFQSNVTMFVIMFVILTSGNFLIEYFANTHLSDIKKKRKNLAYFLLPLNWVIATGFLLLIFV